MTAGNHRSGAERRAITAELARYATEARFAALPVHIREEAARAFMNWMGCALGGSQEPAVPIAVATVAEFGGGPQASIIGHRQRTDIANAAMINCISSSILAFDDAHLATVTHPSGPVCAALFAVAEKHKVSGEDFLAAVALGIEITCRLSNMLLLPPSKFNVGFYVTGLSGPIGVAAAVGNLLRLNEQQMRWALGIAATQSSGFRENHGTMTAHFRPGHAARAGMWAALLADRGFDCSEQSLEAEKGFSDVFSSGADLNRAVDGLGADFEILRNTYKPYPCGIVIHPTLDACLEICAQLAPDDAIVDATIRVQPLTLTLTGERTPADPLMAAVSVYHMVAACLLRGRAGLAEMRQDCIDDPAVIALRDRVVAIADPSIKRDESIVEATLASGAIKRAHVTVTRGSFERKLTDAELDAKFIDQAVVVLSSDEARRLLKLCRATASLNDIGAEIAAVWQA
jgi:2-methylcitrate dehydratase PrpD